MTPPPLREYMSHSILVALAEHSGQSFDHRIVPLLAARAELTEHELRAADARALHAVAELLHNAAPPPLAQLERDGIAGVEADSYADELVSIYRARISDAKHVSFPWYDARDRRAAEARERRAATLKQGDTAPDVAMVPDGMMKAAPATRPAKPRSSTQRPRCRLPCFHPRSGRERVRLGAAGAAGALRGRGVSGSAPHPPSPA